MAEFSECHTVNVGDDDDDDEVSAHSAVSNESDFEEEQEVDYLALELMHHLPADKSEKLLKNLRAKEKAVQDLLNRNRALLDSCKKLDGENQELSERLKLAAAPAAPAAAPAAPPPTPAPTPAKKVDTSFFDQMERSKEEKIIALKSENERLAVQVRRLDEGGRRLEEALAQTKKEVKKLQQQAARRPVEEEDAPQAPRSKGKAPLDPATQSLLEEEERLYQQLQGDTVEDVASRKTQLEQAEARAKIQSTLEGLFGEEKKRIGERISDVAAVLLAVNGLEARLAKSGRKKAANVPCPAPQQLAVSSDQVDEVAAQMVSDFDGMRRQIEDIEKSQLTLEQNVRGMHEGAESAVAALDLDCGLAIAEREADSIRSLNVSVMEAVQGLRFDNIVKLLDRTESALHTVLAKLATAPPGIVSPDVGRGVRETCSEVYELSTWLNGQSQVLSQLKETVFAFRQHVHALQKAQKNHREGLQSRVGEELQRSASALEAPLDRQRLRLRQQGEALVASRARISEALEDFATAIRRSAASTASSGGSATAGATDGSAAPLSEAVQAELREVRTMAKTLSTKLEKEAQAVDGRMEQALKSLVGESKAAARVPDSGAVSEAKRKKGKKKGGGGGGGGGGVISGGGGAGGVASALSGAVRSEEAACSEPGGGGCMGDRDSRDEAVELPESSRIENAMTSSPRHRPDQDEEEEHGRKSHGGRESEGARGVIAGPDLLKELKNQRADAEALEARMAERMASTPKAASAGVLIQPAAEETSKSAAARRRKK